MNRQSMKQQFMKWHRVLTWFALIGIVCWAVSGISHPMMAWFGPQAKKMMPPTFQADTEVLHKLEAVVDQLPVQEAAIAKIVLSQQGTLLQITENEFEPRRYFDLNTGAELANYDTQQAKWLASYYLGTPLDNIVSITFRDSFGAGYPRVNRLLPVYEVVVNADGENLKAFIYTETGALASLNNDFKAIVQPIFRALHTWSWLDATGFGRVLIVALFMLTLLVMASTGLYLVFALPRRNIPKASRRWHRRFAYVLWFPLLAWSASGFYHLIQAEYVQPVSGIRLLDTVQLERFAVGEAVRDDWQASLQQSIPAKGFLTAITLNQSVDNIPRYRLGVATPLDKADGSMSAHAQRKARFAGQALEKSAVYINAQTGQVDDMNDKAMAQMLADSANKAINHTANAAEVLAMSLVTHFGPGYDFRNKRLPVWQVDFNDDVQSRYFVDPVTGILVDQNRKIDRIESLSFSILHKWNILRPLIGPEKRDVLVVITLVALLVISCFGFVMYRARKR